MNAPRNFEPIFVEHFAGDQALRIRCSSCGAERTIGGDEINTEDIYPCPAGACEGWTAEMKYWEATACPICGKRDGWSTEVDGYCSRLCKLQGEYAETLA